MVPSLFIITKVHCVLCVHLCVTHVDHRPHHHHHHLESSLRILMWHYTRKSSLKAYKLSKKKRFFFYYFQYSSAAGIFSLSWFLLNFHASCESHTQKYMSLEIEGSRSIDIITIYTQQYYTHPFYNHLEVKWIYISAALRFRKKKYLFHIKIE